MEEFRKSWGAVAVHQRPLITSRKNADVGSNKGPRLHPLPSPPLPPPPTLLSEVTNANGRRSCTLHIPSLITSDLHISSRAGPNNFELLFLPTGHPLPSASLLPSEATAKRLFRWHRAGSRGELDRGSSTACKRRMRIFFTFLLAKWDGQNAKLEAACLTREI